MTERRTGRAAAALGRNPYPGGLTYGLRDLAETARKRSGVFFTRRGGGYPAHKVLAGVRATQALTVANAPCSRGRAGLVYGARSKRSGPLLHLHETERERTERGGRG